MELLDKLKNFLAPVDEEVIFDDAYVKPSEAATAVAAQQAVDAQQVVGIGVLLCRWIIVGAANKHGADGKRRQHE